MSQKSQEKNGFARLILVQTTKHRSVFVRIFALISKVQDCLISTHFINVSKDSWLIWAHKTNTCTENTEVFSKNKVLTQLFSNKIMVLWLKLYKKIRESIKSVSEESLFTLLKICLKLNTNII